MTNRSPLAGGCLLSISILLGFPLGLTLGNPMKGLLIGTGVGLVLLVITALVERYRS